LRRRRPASTSLLRIVASTLFMVDAAEDGVSVARAHRRQFERLELLGGVIRQTVERVQQTRIGSAGATVASRSRCAIRSAGLRRALRDNMRAAIAAADRRRGCGRRAPREARVARRRGQSAQGTPSPKTTYLGQSAGVAVNTRERSTVQGEVDRLGDGQRCSFSRCA
jgi:hypothetical protein